MTNLIQIYKVNLSLKLKISTALKVKKKVNFNQPITFRPNYIRPIQAY